MIYIGIDNGLTGGLVAVRQPGIIIDSTVMPTRGKSKGNEVDGLAVRDWVLGFGQPITVILETPGKFAKGVQAIASMWDSYGCVRGALESLQIRHQRITPQSWQKVMLPGCKKGQTKPFAKSQACRLWPAQSWLKTPRCTVAHDGLIDAALIAEYGRMKNL